ncbi:hypothetical protein SPH9361_03423 [Sphingobium sp. CECT 9361]|nr:hypothetical protein SPH9361_03423 [Sphingobium sp. CECT 9361]
MAAPCIVCTLVTGYFAITVSPWWLVGTALCMILAEEVKDK